MKKQPIAAAHSGIVFIFLGGLLWGSVFLKDNLALFCLSCLLLMVIAIYSCHKVLAGKFEWYEAINFFFLPMGIGFGLRGIYISLGYYNFPVGIDQKEIFYEHLLYAAMYGFAAVLVFIGGYSLGGLSQKIARKLPVFKHKIRVKILYAVIGTYIAIGIVGLIFLFKKAGFSLSKISLADIAIKRFYLEISHYESSTTEFLTISILILTMIHFGSHKTKIFWPLVLLSCLWPIYSSSRSGLFSIWLMIMISYSLFKGKVSIKLIAAVFAIFLISSSTLLMLRSFQGKSIPSGYNSSLTAGSVVEDIVGGASMADIGVFAHILYNVPDYYEMKQGKTFLTIFSRPIPRSLWPEKPVNLGNWVAIDFYNRPYKWDERGVVQTAGIPPPMVAELYWNFHVIGIVYGMFVFGLLCRILYEYLKLNAQNSYAKVIYAFTCVFVLKYTMVDFSNVSTGLLIQFFLLIVPLWLISGRLVRGKTQFQ